MSNGIIAPTCANTQYEQLSDDQGRLFLFPSAALDAVRATGITTLTLTIPLCVSEEPQWLTLSDAARLHESDVDGMTFDKARSRIRRAIDCGQIHTVDCDGARKIDFDSLSAWRLKAREHNLDEDDI